MLMKAIGITILIGVDGISILVDITGITIMLELPHCFAFFVKLHVCRGHHEAQISIARLTRRKLN